SFGQDSMLQVWDTKTGRPLQDQPRSYVLNVAFSADGTRLAGVGPLSQKEALSRQEGGFGNEGLQSYLWSCAGDELKQLRATPLPLAGAGGPFRTPGLAYSPGGRWLGVWHPSSPSIGIVDAATGAKVEPIRSRSLSKADDVAFNKEGTRLYTVGVTTLSR